MLRQCHFSSNHRKVDTSCGYNSAAAIHQLSTQGGAVMNEQTQPTDNQMEQRSEGTRWMTGESGVSVELRLSSSS